jgi:photosystem II stability/assembly factor-like uncharacterized protein
MDILKRSVISLLILLGVANGDWEVLNEGMAVAFNAYNFINENIGWIATEDGSLLKTTDGAETWNKIEMNETWYFSQIDFITDSFGWAVGSTEEIAPHRNLLNTCDGGQNWNVINMRPDMSDLHIVSIAAISDTLVYTTSFGDGRNRPNELSKILKTTDGGKTWEDISLNELESLSYNTVKFYDSENGIVQALLDIEPRILLTNDGGETWSEKDFERGVENLQIINDSTFYFLSYKSLYKSTDWGESWSRVYQFDLNWIYCFYVASDSVILVCTNHASLGQYNRIGSIIKSTNGGLDWETKFTYNNWNIKSIFFTGNVGILLGDIGGMGATRGEPVIYKTGDYGETWQQKTFSYTFQDVHFINKGLGYSCGGGGSALGHFSYGDILVTQDCGRTWDLIYKSASIIKNCRFVNSTFGYAYPPFIRTFNAGENWEIPNIPVRTDMYFIDRNNGWVIRSWELPDSTGIGILKTIDGGIHWDLDFVKYVPPDNDSRFSFLYFLNEQNGWAIGEQGLIAKYTKEDGWREINSFSYLPFKTIYFIDENLGWLAGGYHNSEEEHFVVLFRTDNGGETWVNITGFDYLVNDLYFADSLHGYAVGSDKKGNNAILETFDSGKTWIVQKDNLIGSLRALNYCDGYLWAVGGCGLVMRTTVDPSTDINERIAYELPRNFTLSPNYPNPFNPITIIQYEVPTQARVRLTIYDILGREVKTLLNRTSQPGTFEIIWDGADGFENPVAGGVYFCRMQASDFVKTIKLALVR